MNWTIKLDVNHRQTFPAECFVTLVLIGPIQKLQKNVVLLLPLPSPFIEKLHSPLL